jgi:hypothetical protein
MDNSLHTLWPRQNYFNTDERTSAWASTVWGNEIDEILRQYYWLSRNYQEYG